MATHAIRIDRSRPLAAEPGWHVGRPAWSPTWHWMRQSGTRRGDAAHDHRIDHRGRYAVAMHRRLRALSRHRIDAFPSQLGERQPARLQRPDTGIDPQDTRGQQLQQRRGRVLDELPDRVPVWATQLVRRGRCDSAGWFRRFRASRSTRTRRRARTDERSVRDVCGRHLWLGQLRSCRRLQHCDTAGRWCFPRGQASPPRAVAIVGQQSWAPAHLDAWDERSSPRRQRADLAGDQRPR